MFEDSELIWPALEMLLKVLGWSCWVLVLLWATGGVLNFPGSQLTMGVVLLVVVLGGLFGAAAYSGNRAIFIYGIWCFDLVVLLALWMVQPRSDRVWAADMEHGIAVRYEGDVAILRNVRDFRYDTESDFEADWVERRIPLGGLQKVWLGVEQIAAWEGVAHVFVTFEYVDEQQQSQALAVSAEIHRQQGEEFAVFPGLYRNFELTYVVGTERDLIGLRTHVRVDPVRLYPLEIDRVGVTSLFRDVLQRAEKLQIEPEFYHTITNNCASNMLYHLNKLAPSPVSKWDKRVIFSGLVDRIAYSLDVVPNVSSLEEMRAKYLVNIANFELDEQYSKKLRDVGFQHQNSPEVVQ